MTNPKSKPESFAALLNTAFKLFKLCLIGVSTVSLPLFARRAFISAYDLFSVVLPQVREMFSAWLTPPVMYVIVNCIILAIVANASVHHRGFNINAVSHAPHDYNTSSSTADLQQPVIAESATFERSSGRGTQTETEKMVNRSASSELKKPLAQQRKPGSMSLHMDSLGVARWNKEKTLEATWKTITDGRRPPLTRHLRKADTWEREKVTDTHSQRDCPSHPSPSSSSMRFRKSETWNSSRSRSEQVGGLRRQPSLSQDELNKRVEAFIAKVNNNMKLEREQSLLHYTEMVNRGTG